MRKTNQESAQKKFTDAELLDIQSELDEKIKNTPANRIINSVGICIQKYKLGVRFPF